MILPDSKGSVYKSSDYIGVRITDINKVYAGLEQVHRLGMP